MNRTLAIVLVVALAASAYLMGRSQPGRPAGGAGPLPPVTGTSEANASDAAVGEGSRVGFVDLQTVYNTCKQAKAFEVEMRAFGEEVKKQVEPIEMDLEKLRERLQLLGPGASDRAALEDQVKAKLRERDRLAEPWYRDGARKQLKKRSELYDKIREVTGRVAKSRGLEVVIADIEDPHPNLGAEDLERLDMALKDYTERIHRKRLLYGAKSVDLTQAVLDAVNAEP